MKRHTEANRSWTYIDCLVEWDKILRRGIGLALKELRPAEYETTYRALLDSLTRRGLTRTEFRSAVSALSDCGIKAVRHAARCMLDIRLRVSDVLLGKRRLVTAEDHQWWAASRRDLWNICTELRNTDASGDLPRDSMRILLGTVPTYPLLGYDELGFEPPFPDRIARSGGKKRDSRLEPRAGDIFQLGGEYVQIVRKLPKKVRKLILGNKSETPAKFIVRRGAVLGISERFHHFGMEDVKLREVVQPFVTATYTVEGLTRALVDATPISRSLKDKPDTERRVKVAIDHEHWSEDVLKSPPQVVVSKDPFGSAVILEPDLLQPEPGEDTSDYED